MIDEKTKDSLIKLFLQNFHKKKDPTKIKFPPEYILENFYFQDLMHMDEFKDLDWIDFIGTIGDYYAMNSKKHKYCVGCLFVGDLKAIYQGHHLNQCRGCVDYFKYMSREKFQKNTK